MAFDPNVPGPHAELTSEMFRGQYNGLKEIIDAQAGLITVLQMQLTALQAQVAAIPDGPPGEQGPPGADGQQGPPGQGLVMQGDWLDYQTYLPGDVVAYNNQTYVTMTGAVGTPPDQAANWRLLSITGPAGAPGEVSLYQLNAAIQAQASRNCDVVQMIDGSSFSAEGQAIVAKINELLAVLHSPI